MTKFVAAKWTSIAAMLSASLFLSGCETTAGKPTVTTVKCKQGPCKVVKKKPVREAATTTRGRSNY
jgi:dethiobiotin synthetase